MNKQADPIAWRKLIVHAPTMQDQTHVQDVHQSASANRFAALMKQRSQGNDALGDPVLSGAKQEAQRVDNPVLPGVQSPIRSDSSLGLKNLLERSNEHKDSEHGSDASASEEGGNVSERVESAPAAVCGELSISTPERSVLGHRHASRQGGWEQMSQGGAEQSLQQLLASTDPVRRVQATQSSGFGDGKGSGCADHIVDAVGEWSGTAAVGALDTCEVQIPLPQDALPDTTLTLEVSPSSLQLRFSTSHSGSRELLLQQRVALAQRLQERLGVQRAIEIAIE